MKTFNLKLFEHVSAANFSNIKRPQRFIAFPCKEHFYQVLQKQYNDSNKTTLSIKKKNKKMAILYRW